MSTSITTPALALAALFAAGCGGPLLSAEFEDPRICFRVAGQTIAGAPAGLSRPTVSWTGQLDLSRGVPALAKQGATTGEVRMIELFLESTTDLSALSSAALEVQERDPDDSTGIATRTLVHATYARPPAVANLNRVDFVLEQPAGNLIDALDSQAGILRYRASLTGKPPTEAWRADVTACVYVHVAVDLTKL